MDERILDAMRRKMEADSVMDDRALDALDSIANATERIAQSLEKIEERTRQGGALDILNSVRFGARIISNAIEAEARR